MLVFNAGGGVEEGVSRFAEMDKEELKIECKRKHLPVGGNVNVLRGRLERATFGQGTIMWGKRPRAGGGEIEKSGRDLGREAVGGGSKGWEANDNVTGIDEAGSGTALGSLREDEECSKSTKAETLGSVNGDAEDWLSK